MVKQLKNSLNMGEDDRKLLIDNLYKEFKRPQTRRELYEKMVGVAMGKPPVILDEGQPGGEEEGVVSPTRPPRPAEAQEEEEEEEPTTPIQGQGRKRNTRTTQVYFEDELGQRPRIRRVKLHEPITRQLNQLDREHRKILADLMKTDEDQLADRLVMKLIGEGNLDDEAVRGRLYHMISRVLEGSGINRKKYDEGEEEQIENEDEYDNEYHTEFWEG